MPDQNENLPDENASAGETLDFTAEEVLSELARYFSPCEDRRPGDLDLKQIADYYGIGEEWARKTAYRLVERGVLVKVYVKNPNGRKMLVFRKV